MTTMPEDDHNSVVGTTGHVAGIVAISWRSRRYQVEHSASTEPSELVAHIDRVGRGAIYLQLNLALNHGDRIQVEVMLPRRWGIQFVQGIEFRSGLGKRPMTVLVRLGLANKRLQVRPIDAPFTLMVLRRAILRRHN